MSNNDKSDFMKELERISENKHDYNDDKDEQKIAKDMVKINRICKRIARMFTKRLKRAAMRTAKSRRKKENFVNLPIILYDKEWTRLLLMSNFAFLIPLVYWPWKYFYGPFLHHYLSAKRYRKHFETAKSQIFNILRICFSKIEPNIELSFSDGSELEPAKKPYRKYALFKTRDKRRFIIRLTLRW